MISHQALYSLVLVLYLGMNLLKYWLSIYLQSFLIEKESRRELLQPATKNVNLNKVLIKAWPEDLASPFVWTNDQSLVPDNNCVNFPSFSIVFVKTFLKKNGLEIDSILGVL